MIYDSLSDAIRSISQSSNSLSNVPPFGELSFQSQIAPSNNAYVNPPNLNVITYGKTIWGTGHIINLLKPNL